MGKGRKRKNVKRERNGRASRAGYPRRIEGNMRAQAMQVLYGTDGCDAIGRAFRSGLLGEGSDAKAMLDTARSIANAYWQAYETGAIRCTLAEPMSGTVTDIDHERIKRREEWLAENMEVVNRMGHEVRRAFDQLVIDINPDHGPLWLDRLCYAERTHAVEAKNADQRALRAALDALEALAL